MIQSFIMLEYVLRVRPFESPVENFLLVFNELTVIAAVCHMIVFSDAYSGSTSISPELKSKAGWTFCYLILSQIVVNLTLYLSEATYKVYRILRRQWRSYWHQRAKRAQEEKEALEDT